MRTSRWSEGAVTLSNLLRSSFLLKKHRGIFDNHLMAICHGTTHRLTKLTIYTNSTNWGLLFVCSKMWVTYS